MPIDTTAKVFFIFKLNNTVNKPAYKNGLLKNAISLLLCPRNTIGIHIAVNTAGAVKLKARFILVLNSNDTMRDKNKYRHENVIHAIPPSTNQKLSIMLLLNWGEIAR